MHITQKRKPNLLKTISPTRIIVSSFALIIFTGACLLSLPIASNDGKSIGFLDALFTATSATCVTGLVVADTLTQWTVFGQVVILIMIQIGAL
ncbi:MAG: Trk family potassium uptake protein, partial [Bacillota bacterium]